MGRLTNSNGLRYGFLFPWLNNELTYNKRFYKNLSLERYILFLCNNVILKDSLGQSLGLIAASVKIKRFMKGYLVVLEIYDGELLEKGVRDRVARYSSETRLLLLEYLIQKACKNLFKSFVFVEFQYLKKEQLSSDLLCEYIGIKLYQGFSLMDIVFSLRRTLRHVKGLSGFRLDFKGRFTRRQRASSLSVKVGRVPFSELSSRINYSEGSVVLKYGKCGFKVWLNKEF